MHMHMHTTQAEIEWFVKPGAKAHAKFESIAGACLLWRFLLWLYSPWRPFFGST